jgi:hypothetical protein
LRGRRGVGAALAGVRLRAGEALGAAFLLELELELEAAGRRRGGVLVEDAVAIGGLVAVGVAEAGAVARVETEPAAEGDHERGLIAHDL